MLNKCFNYCSNTGNGRLKLKIQTADVIRTSRLSGLASPYNSDQAAINLVSPGVSVLSPRFDKEILEQIPTISGGSSIDEEKHRSFGILKLGDFLSRGQRRLWLIGVCLSILQGCIVLVMPYMYGLVQKSFENQVRGQTTSDTYRNEMRTYVLVFCVTGCVTFFVSFFSNLIWIKVSTWLYLKIMERLFRKMVNNNVIWFEKRAHSFDEVYLNSLFSDLRSVQKMIASTLPLLLKGLSTSLFSIILAIFSAWALGLAVFASVIIVLVFLLRQRMQVNDSYAAASVLHSKILEYLVDIFENISVVYAFGAQEKESSILNNLSGQRCQTLTKTYQGFSVFLGIANFLLTSTFALAYGYGGHLVKTGSVTSGNVLQVFNLSTFLFTAVLELAAQLPNLAQGISSFRNITSIIFEKTAENSGYLGLDKSVFRGEIIVQSVNFRYPNGKQKVLKDLSFEIGGGSFIGIAGASGSAKTTVFQLLLKFYDNYEGIITIDGYDLRQISDDCLRGIVNVVTQEPYLFNTTIWENLTIGKNLLMSEVEEACKVVGAHDFICKLPKGYNTDIGDHGSLLSTGQKQRLVIARAILRKPIILLLDEATSYLDVQSEKNVMVAIRGYLSSSTIISIAHRLDSLRNADSIMVFHRGRVVEQGNYEFLSTEKNGIFKNLLKKSSSAKPKEESKIIGNKGKSIDGFRKSTDKMYRNSVLSQRNSTSFKYEEHSRLWRLLRSVELPKSKILWLVLISTICGLSFPLCAFIIALTMESYTNNFDNDAIYRSVAFFMGLAAFKGVFYAARFWLASSISNSFQHKTRVLAFESLLLKEYSWYDIAGSLSSDVWAKKVNDNPSSVQLVFLSVIPDLVELIALLLGSGVLAIAYGWKLALISFATAPVLMLSSYFALSSLTNLDNRITSSGDELSSFCIQFFDSIRTVICLSIQNYSIKNFLSAAAWFERDIWFRILKAACFVALFNAVGPLCEAFVLYFSSEALLTEGYKYINVLTVLTSIVLCSNGVQQTSRLFADFAEALGAAKSIGDFVQAKRPKIGSEKDGMENITGSVEIKNVSFCYPSRPEVTVLRGINLRVEQGEKLAIVGESGIGKSSIFALLLKMYKPISGTIMVGHLNLKAIENRMIPRILGWVPQESRLLKRTIFDNITYSEKEQVSDKQSRIENVIAASKKANIHDFINTLKDGYDTPIGESGLQLSGGQSQRIALARAFYSNAKILLLDEFSASLDFDSEATVINEISKLSSNQTVIVITHRLSSLAIMDRIAVVKNGSISEQGSYSSLMESQGDLYHLQTAYNDI
jgi:ABC-type multidrug transport system fused ATPase/permease subunit